MNWRERLWIVLAYASGLTGAIGAYVTENTWWLIGLCVAVVFITLFLAARNPPDGEQPPRQEDTP